MKKHIYAILMLGAAGTAVSAVLLMNHFYPDSGFSLMCGGGFENRCLALSVSGYASVYGIPIAAFGLFFYLTIVFTVLIADYAGGEYLAPLTAFLLPLTSAALAADLALAVILVVITQFCVLCFVTYILNILLCALVLIMYKKIRPEGKKPLITLFQDTERFFSSAPHARAAAAGFVLFIFLLGFAVFSTSHILKIKTMKAEVSKSDIAAFLKNFHESEEKALILPESCMTIGDPKGVKIVVFTDFLCSYCHKFFLTEKRLFAKYGRGINITYYHYPLDSSCNDSVPKTVYGNSCVASRAVNAAAKLGILKQYLLAHFDDYAGIHSKYDDAVPLDTLRKAAGGSIDMNRFIEVMNSKEISDTMARHIDAARANGISATPTLIIAGRLINGLPPVEFLEALIESEMKL